MLAESFITTAKASYEKSNASSSGTGGTIGSQAQVSRKRTKDTSGPEASPNTSQCRPVAKRLTAECPGRRLLILIAKGEKSITLDLFLLTQHRLIIALATE